jgi:micrococcal nuclease
MLLLLCVTVSGLASCDILSNIFNPQSGTTDGEKEWVDYAAQLKLDLKSPSLKWEVKNATTDVKNYIDGDTTHFYINSSGNINGISQTPGIDGVLKARYLGINTPESTGKIEPWGKAASNFTKEKVMGAESIIIESEDNNWNVDSTGERFLVWVWYKMPGETEYRNLNLEILQNGLAVANTSVEARYNEICSKAIAQAVDAKKYVYSPANVLDPDFPYGDAQFMTLKELKINIADYIGARVAFEGVIVKDSGGSVYIESYDEEDGIYYGISAYYLTSGLDGFGLEILKVGNKLRFAGVVGEFNGSYQITDLKYDVWDTNNSKNMSLISEGNTPGYQEITALHFDAQSNQGSVRVETEVDGEVVMKELPFMYMAQDASVSMKNLKVKSVYTTAKGDSKGAMTLYCQDANGNEIQVRTIVLRDANDQLVTASAFQGKTIDVKGTIDYYLPEGESTGSYQIQLFSIDDVTFH